MDYSDSHLGHWTRQFDQSAKRIDTRVFQIRKLASSPGERELIVAMTSKASAQRLIAAFAEIEGSERYRVTCFDHPYLPGCQDLGLPH
jgi:hypothetical protein